MSIQRECCNYCMWLGPVNKDGTMRKHRPATRDDKWGRTKVQDMSAPPCPGSHQIYARFGNDTPQETTAMTEYGLFNDEGCFEAQMYSVTEAEGRRAEYIAEGEEPEDVMIKEMCPDHEGEARVDCSECWSEPSEEDDEDDEDEPHYELGPTKCDTCSVCGKESCQNEICGTERTAQPTIPTVCHEGAPFHPVDFRDIAEGDTVLFLTADNGYGGSGSLVKRTGIVRRKTEDSMIVDCGSHWLGRIARLTRRAWKQRDVHRATHTLAA